MNKQMLLLVAMSIFFILGCCQLNTNQEVQPSNCQCNKLDKLIGKSLEQPNIGDHYYKIVGIKMIELRDVIYQNRSCWIGKPYDYVRKILPPPIKTKNDGSYIYSAIEDVRCKGDDCKFLQFSFDDYLGDREFISNIEVSRGKVSSNDWIIRLYTAKR